MPVALRPLLAVLVAVGAWLPLAIATAGPAAAHAVLIGTQPADGARLQSAPSAVVAEFNEPVTPAPQAVRVHDSAGEGPEPTMVQVGLPDALPEDVYTVSWRVVSADGHPVQGGFVFTVGDLDVDPDALVLQEPGDAPWQALAAFVRWVTYAGTLLAAGGSLSSPWSTTAAVGSGPRWSG